MSKPRKITIKFYRRAGYLMFLDRARLSKVRRDRDLIARCYEIS